ncbi:MAG: hypothetical protein PHE24_02990 [Patescibacteria group bacterium]|nr:hypothetical protein [Patescibacteria group bacterium]
MGNLNSLDKLAGVAISEDPAEVKDTLEKFVAAVDKVHMARQEVLEERGRHYNALSPKEKTALISRRVEENDRKIKEEINELTS